jgi:ParB/RepB/Spo0J family partition protein
MEARLIEINKIDVPEGYRREMNDRQRTQLAASISNIGLIRPILARCDGDRYTLIKGSRRLSACKHLRWTSITSIVYPESDRRPLDLIRHEVSQKAENLSVLYEAQIIKRLIDEHGFTMKRVGLVVGKDRETVRELLACLNLNDYWAEYIKSGELTVAGIRPITILSHEGQRLAARIIKKKNLPLVKTTFRRIADQIDPDKNPELFAHATNVAATRKAAQSKRGPRLKKQVSLATKLALANMSLRVLERQEQEVSVATLVIEEILSNEALCAELPVEIIRGFKQVTRNSLVNA